MKVTIRYEGPISPIVFSDEVQDYWFNNEAGFFEILEKNGVSLLIPYSRIIDIVIDKEASSGKTDKH